MEARLTLAQDSLAPSLRRALWHLRLYECAQAAVPAAIGMIIAGASTDAGLRVLIAVLSHLLFIYNFNDLCDRAEDLANPRKLAKTTAGMQSLKRGVCALSTALFSVTLFLVPPLVAILLIALHLTGTAYSLPRFRFKAHPPASLAYHLFSGAGYLLAGAWAVSVKGSPGLAAAAAFFALSYAAGNLNSELLDLEFDRQAGLRTLASRLGARNAMRTVMLLQLGALAALSLWVGGLPGAGFLIAFSAWLAFIYKGFLERSEAGLDQMAALALRSRYRLLFSLAALAPLAKMAWSAIGPR